MATYLYRNNQMEQNMLKKINDAANKRYGGDIPADVQARIAAETQHIIGNGYGTLLAAAADLAGYSTAHGYHVGIRGLIGNLYVAHLLGIAVNDPMELGLRWEACLSPDGTQMPVIALNVAPELLNDLRAHLREILPECDVLFGPGIPHKRIIIVPRTSGVYDPANEYLSLALCPHELMSRVGNAWHRIAGADSFDEDLITHAYRMDAEDIPIVDKLGNFQDLASMLGPKSFSDLVKVMGLFFAWKVQFQAYHIPLLPDRFDHLVGTQEDIYDICVRYGIGTDDAFQIMRQAVRGKLAPESRDILAAQGLPDVFLETLDNADCLYPRGQCADYVYWALTILLCRQQAGEQE